MFMLDCLPTICMWTKRNFVTDGVKEGWVLGPVTPRSHSDCGLDPGGHRRPYPIRRYISLFCVLLYFSGSWLSPPLLLLLLPPPWPVHPSTCTALTVVAHSSPPLAVCISRWSVWVASCRNVVFRRMGIGCVVLSWPKSAMQLFAMLPSTEISASCCLNYQTANKNIQQMGETCPVWPHC